MQLKASLLVFFVGIYAVVAEGDNNAQDVHQGPPFKAGNTEHNEQDHPSLQPLTPPPQRPPPPPQRPLPPPPPQRPLPPPPPQRPLPSPPLHRPPPSPSMPPQDQPPHKLPNSEYHYYANELQYPLPPNYPPPTPYRPPPNYPPGYFYYSKTPHTQEPPQAPVSQNPSEPQNTSQTHPPRLLSFGHKFANALMQEFYYNYHKQIKRANSKITANNDALFLRFVAWERNLNTKHDMDINDAVKDGKKKPNQVKDKNGDNGLTLSGRFTGRDERRIEDCLYKKRKALRHKLHTEWRRIDTCREDATTVHKKILEDIGRMFSATLKKSSIRERNWGREVYLCHDDEACIKHANDTLSEDFRNTMEEGERVLKMFDEAPKKHKILLDYCVQDFYKKLDHYEKHFLSFLQECKNETDDYDEQMLSKKRSLKAKHASEVETKA